MSDVTLALQMIYFLRSDDGYINDSLFFNLSFYHSTNRKDKFLADLRKAREQLADDTPALRKVRYAQSNSDNTDISAKLSVPEPIAEVIQGCHVRECHNIWDC